MFVNINDQLINFFSIVRLEDMGNYGGVLVTLSNREQLVCVNYNTKEDLAKHIDAELHQRGFKYRLENL